MNSAYRSDLGKSWTNEAKIVAGPRIDAAQLPAGLNEPNFELWVLEDNRQILGCIGLSFNQNYAEIGSYCVDPNQQNLGLGKKLLAFAEDYVKGSHALIRYLEMFVLNVRTE